MRLESYFSDISLTPSQRDVLTKLERFLNSSTHDVFILKGYAGTGKTFLTSGITRYLRDNETHFHLCAPTAKAAKVLSNKSGFFARTIHSLIYQRPEPKDFRLDFDVETGTYRMYAPIKTNSDNSTEVYIVDESSMVSDAYSDQEFLKFGSGKVLSDLIQFINFDHNDHHKKLIFIGDNAQLPPIGMNFSPALNSDYLNKNFGLTSIESELTDVVRQKADSPILKLATKIRKAIQNKNFFSLKIDSQNGDIEIISPEDVGEFYIDINTSGETFKNSDTEAAMKDKKNCMDSVLTSSRANLSRNSNSECCTLAHSNQSVLHYNQMVKRLADGDEENIVPGEVLVVVKNSYPYDAHNGDFLLVSKVGKKWSRKVTLKRKNQITGRLEQTEITLNFREVVGRLEDFEERRYIIMENLLNSTNAYLSSDENKALYVDFCIRHPDLKENTAEFRTALIYDLGFNALNVKFGYSLTCHKAQGSQWRNVIVDCKYQGNKKSESYLRWLYTAITRASHKLFLVNPPSFSSTLGLRGVQLKSRPLSGVQRINKNASNVQETLGEKEQISSPSQESPLNKNGMHKEGNNFYEVPQGNEIAGGKQQIIRREEDSSLNGSKPEKIAEKLGLSPAYPFFYQLCLKVVEATNRFAEVIGISHQNYKELYLFESNGKKAKIALFYNGKDRITNISSQGFSEIAPELLNLLKPLTGWTGGITEKTVSKEIIFEEEFLKDFDQKLRKFAQLLEINIGEVRPLQYALRYSLSKDDDYCTFDVFYNGKGEFTNVRFQKHPHEPLLSLCQELIDRVVDSEE